MEFSLSATPLCSESQVLRFEKIAILMGENGSGKSLLLESVFDDRMGRRNFNDHRVVCFSSGHNERFSEAFTKYLNKERELEKPIDLNCFYYDKLLSKLLIFLSTSLKPDGYVRAFLRQKDYVDENDESQDVSSHLSLRFSVPNHYVKRVQKALVEEESSGKSVLRTTPFFRTLVNFIETYIDETYDFDTSMSPLSVELTPTSLMRASYLGERPGLSPNGINDFEGDDNPVVRFFTQASDADYFINRQKMQLKLKDGLELENLSDGEYQQLFVYALIDLFDSPKTLFLLDEVDSHLHYKNLSKLWNVFKSIKGSVITTTHLLDTITANEFDDIKVVNEGRITDEHKLKQVLGRLEVLSNASFMEYEVCARVKHIVLIDDCNDWDIFLRLATRKGLDTKYLSNVHAHKKTSGYGSISEKFAHAKIQWVEEFFKTKDIHTSNIFLICDKDKAHPNFDVKSGVKVHGSFLKGIPTPKNTKVPVVHLLAWKRREIKNYLLSYTSLKHLGALDLFNNDKHGIVNHLKKNDPGDNVAVQDLDAKFIINQFVNRNEYGFCPQLLQEYINLIPPEEISEDIVNMYNYIARTI